MSGHPFIVLKLNPPSAPESVREVTGYLNSLYFYLSIAVADTTISFENEPVADFLAAYHAALVGSMVFGNPSLLSFFSDDVFVEMTKASGAPGSIDVKLMLAGTNVAQSQISEQEAADVFRTAISEVIGAMRSRFSYEDIVRCLSAPMIPENEEYLPHFLAADGP